MPPGNTPARSTCTCPPPSTNATASRPSGQVRVLLDRVAAGETAVTKMTASAGNLAEAAIGLFLEYRDLHGYDDEAAAAKAVLEIHGGTQATRELAAYDLDTAGPRTSRQKKTPERNGHVSSYPEHDKQHAVMDQAQVIGEFLIWLRGQGIELMTWREDLTELRPADPECTVRFNSDDPQPCDQIRDEGDGAKPRAWWRRHCKHWQDPQREAAGSASQGHCCRCGKGRVYQADGIEGWVHDGRGIGQLLADWAGIDLSMIAAEKQQMLATARKG